MSFTHFLIQLKGNFMAKQFCYQDQFGKIYPEHAALRFEPSLVPGFFDTETKTFTPVGNPQKQVGNIIVDAGFGDKGPGELKSGLDEDKGAMTAPLNGVAFAGVARAEGEAVEETHTAEETPVVAEAETTASDDEPKKRARRKVD